MIKKKLLLTSIFFIFFITTSFAKTPLRDELKNLIRLSDYNIGEKRVLKAIKYEKKGRYKKSNKLYSQALKYFLLANKQTPANSNIYFYLGFTSEKLKKIMDAEIYYSLALDIDPDNNKIRKSLGTLFVQDNNFDQAKEILKVLKDCNCEEYGVLKEIFEKQKILSN